MSIIIILALITEVFTLPLRNPIYRSSQPLNLIQANHHEAYSENWAGVVLSLPPGSVQSVNATVTVPEPSAIGGTEQQAGSAWVGIDGDSCQTAILQTGVDWFVNPDNTTGYAIWYEWFPAPSFNFPSMEISAGDVLFLSVIATSNKTGNATIVNKTTNATVNQQLSSDYALCGQDAEWIVEDYSVGGGLVPFAGFSTVQFDNAVASSGTGETYQSGNGSLIDINQDGQVLTQSSQPNATTVVVEHV